MMEARLRIDSVWTRPPKRCLRLLRHASALSYPYDVEPRNACQLKEILAVNLRRPEIDLSEGGGERDRAHGILRRTAKGGAGQFQETQV